MNFMQNPPAQHTSEMLLGSDAIAYGVKLCRPEVIAAYPITPQTHIIETLSSMVDSGEMPSEYIKVESEMSAIAACFGSVAAGSRSFTATSSHGLALMHEMLHWFAASRFPLVMVNANRALGAPWNIWTDQSDSLAQRDTGWLQIYCETAQEALDTILLSYWLTERIMLPVMVMIDGFILSHTMEQLFVPEQDLADRFLPAYQAPYHLDTENPLSFGAAATPDNFYNLRKALAKTMKNVPKEIEEGAERFSRLFHRRYANLEGYRLEGAEVVIVSSGALTGTVRIAVDRLRDAGKKVGLVKLRLFRPFPREELLEMVQGVPDVLAFSRAVSYGAGGTLAQELRASLYHLESRPRIFDVIISLGGKEVFPETVIDVVQGMGGLSPVNSNWF